MLIVPAKTIIGRVTLLLHNGYCLDSLTRYLFSIFRADVQHAVVNPRHRDLCFSRSVTAPPDRQSRLQSV